jgi:hypothetical protein
MIKVIWNSGHEPGFNDVMQAQRFIDSICKVIAPNLCFIIRDEKGFR